MADGKGNREGLDPIVEETRDYVRPVGGPGQVRPKAAVGPRAAGSGSEGSATWISSQHIVSNIGHGHPQWWPPSEAGRDPLLHQPGYANDMRSRRPGSSRRPAGGTWQTLFPREDRGERERHQVRSWYHRRSSPASGRTTGRATGA
jgi:hypothetical protein